MVKCIQTCLIFLKRLFVSQSQSPSIIVQPNPENLNVTSINDKEHNPKHFIENDCDLNSPCRSPKNLEEHTAKIIIPSSAVSEISLSPISKRSQSEELSPIKIPSPRVFSRIPGVFHSKHQEKMPKIYAATPRIRLPQGLHQIIQVK